MKMIAGADANSKKKFKNLKNYFKKKIKKEMKMIASAGAFQVSAKWTNYRTSSRGPLQKMQNKNLAKFGFFLK